jgi:hypothetical protein
MIKHIIPFTGKNNMEVGKSLLKSMGFGVLLTPIFTLNIKETKLLYVKSIVSANNIYKTYLIFSIKKCEGKNGSSFGKK